MKETYFLVSPADMGTMLLLAALLGLLIGVMICLGAELRRRRQRDRARRRLSMVCSAAVSDAAERESKTRWAAVTAETALPDDAQ